MLEIQIFTKRFFKCPTGCMKMFEVEHLMKEDNTVGPWHCEECGIGWSVNTKDGKVLVEPMRTRSGMVFSIKNTIVLLEIPPLNHSIFLKVKGSSYKSEASESENFKNNDRYFYGEGTCPENYFRETEQVIVNGYRDPYGLATYITTVETDSEFDDALNNHQVAKVMES